MAGGVGVGSGVGWGGSGWGGWSGWGKENMGRMVRKRTAGFERKVLEGRNHVGAFDGKTGGMRKIGPSNLVGSRLAIQDTYVLSFRGYSLGRLTGKPNLVCHIFMLGCVSR